MKISRLRDKLLLGAIAIGIVVALASMLAASLVIRQQQLDASNDLLTKASEVVNDSLSERKANLLAVASQLASQKNLGSTIWYLAQYAQSNLDRETLLNTYQQLTRDIYKIGRVAKLSRIAIYDSAGHLVSFALFDNGSEQAGFVERFPVPSFQLAALKEGEELNAKILRKTSSVPGIGFELGARLPQQEGGEFAVVGGLLSIRSHVPIMGESFDPSNGKPEIRQLGLVVMEQALDQAFVDHLSRLTDTRINVFTPQGFGSGNVAAYRTPDWSGVQPKETDTRTSAAIFNEVKIEGMAFYQSLIPLYSDHRLAGTIAVLHSREVVQKNTWEVIRTLGLIAAASLLFIIPFSWYFATSISRPISALGRIFSGVANGRQTDTLGDELTRLGKEAMRSDELGELTQSFIAMNDAINQKIRQINEINASLEKTVKMRTAALAASEQESRTLIENSPDTIARYDRECRRLYVNPAFGALSEGGVAALLGRRPSECPGGKNSEIYEAKIKEVFATGKNTQFELKWRGKDGKEICSHIRLTAERDLSGEVITVLGVGRDITELNESRAELGRKEQAKSRFLAAAGHDLRQPLAAANLFIDALKFTEPTPDQGQIIKQLDQAMGTFNGLLDALLNISRLDAGIIRPEYTSINVAELFDWLEQSFAPLANEKKIGFKLHFPLGEPLGVRSDTGLLKSVLMNLVSNAIKYTSQGSILVAARRRGSEVLFQVWDTGIGISGEHIQRIYDEFYQINNPQRDRTGGLGLGLSIAKRAISLLGGEISCRSRVGHGSVFEFRLPVDDAQGGLAQQVDAGIHQEHASQTDFVRGKRFVVVEDDLLVAEALSKALLGMGGEVSCFHKADKALHDANIEHADYYIVDYMLGDSLNGIQFLEQLRQKVGRPVNAVLMTGDTSPAFVRDVANFAWPVLHKPARMSELIVSLEAQST